MAHAAEDGRAALVPRLIAVAAACCGRASVAAVAAAVQPRGRRRAGGRGRLCLGQRLLRGLLRRRRWPLLLLLISAGQSRAGAPAIAAGRLPTVLAEPLAQRQQAGHGGGGGRRHQGPLCDRPARLLHPRAVEWLEPLGLEGGARRLCSIWPARLLPRRLSRCCAVDWCCAPHGWPAAAAVAAAATAPLRRWPPPSCAGPRFARGGPVYSRLYEEVSPGAFVVSWGRDRLCSPSTPKSVLPPEANRNQRPAHGCSGPPPAARVGDPNHIGALQQSVDRSVRRTARRPHSPTGRGVCAHLSTSDLEIENILREAITRVPLSAVAARRTRHETERGAPALQA